MLNKQDDMGVQGDLWLFGPPTSLNPKTIVNDTKRRKNKKNKKVDAKDVVLPHSRAKLTLYSNYLEKYLAILSVVPSIEKVHIFDIFCGTGIYKDQKPGSPILAFNNISKVDDFLNNSLKTTVKQTVLYINDLKEENVNKVKDYLSNLTKHPKLNIEYSNIDAQQMLENVLVMVGKQSYKERNLIFLDPYGYSQIKKETIAKLMRTKKVEIILFLPASHMHRFKKVVQLENKKAYNALRDFIFDFFEDDHPIRSVQNSENKISIFEFIKYLREALSLGDACFSTSFYLQRDSSNYYALFFMTNSILGLERFIDLKWHIDQTKGEGFVLEKVQMQQSIFESLWHQPDLEQSILQLEKIIINAICGSSNINNCDLYYITLMSNFRPTHAVQVLKKLQNAGVINVSRIDGKKAAKGAFYVNYDHYSGKRAVINVSFSK